MRPRHNNILFILFMCTGQPSTSTQKQDDGDETVDDIWKKPVKVDVEKSRLVGALNSSI